MGEYKDFNHATVKGATCFEKTTWLFDNFEDAVVFKLRMEGVAAALRDIAVPDGYPPFVLPVRDIRYATWKGGVCARVLKMVSAPVSTQYSS
jgi:hypothetical protein